MNFSYYIRKAKDVRLKDAFSMFPMIGALALVPFYKHRNSGTWVICERENEARDNGYHFFRYMCMEQKQQRCVYAIKRKSNDYYKVSSLGETVEYGSLSHWILYFTAQYLIGSQNSMPNGYVATLFERIGLFKPEHVFLQHGITKDMAEFLLASHRRAKYFIAGALPEYEFMKENFGYEEGTMRYTGFARFDALHSKDKKRRMILIMPTWRKWLWLKSEEHADAKMNLDESEYFDSWRRLLTDKRLRTLIEEYNVEFVFQPHPNMQKLLSGKRMSDPCIRIATPDNDDLQELLKSASLLITDYSSVFFDMAYMKKPVIFFQFDEEKYRRYHYQQGWFDYHKTSFGEWCSTADQVVEQIEKAIKRDFSVLQGFEEEHRSTFPLYDSDNSRRIFEVLTKNNINIYT